MALTAWGAAIAASTSIVAGAAPSPERSSAAAPELLRRVPPIDNVTSADLASINAALLNLIYIEPVPYGEIICCPTDPSLHQFARADAGLRKGIPNLAAGRRDSCDVAFATGMCEHLWCGANSGSTCTRRGTRTGFVSRARGGAVRACGGC